MVRYSKRKPYVYYSKQSSEKTVIIIIIGMFLFGRIVYSATLLLDTFHIKQMILFHTNRFHIAVEL